MSRNMIYSWQYCFSKKHQQFSHSENSAKSTGTITIGPVVRHHNSSKNGRRIECNTANYVPFVVPGLSTSSSSSEVIAETRSEGRTLHFASFLDVCHLKSSELEPNFQKYKGRVGTPRCHCKIWFRLLRSIYRARFIGVTNDGCKSNGCHIKTARMRRASSWCSICFFPGKTGRCSKIIENSQSQKVQTFGYVYQNTNGQNHGPAWKTQSFLLSEICTVILWQDFYGKQFEKLLLEHGWWKVPKWECLFVKREKGLLLSVYVDNFKLARKKQNIDPMWKVLVKEIDLGEPT